MKVVLKSEPHEPTVTLELRKDIGATGAYILTGRHSGSGRERVIVRITDNGVITLPDAGIVSLGLTRG